MPEHCSELWFEDGNVVLQAEQTLFKVYRGPLRQQSPFFHDLFTLPQQDSEESEQYEGCPLVYMHGDSANDVKLLLKAVFDFQYGSYPVVQSRSSLTAL